LVGSRFILPFSPKREKEKETKPKQRQSLSRKRRNTPTKENVVARKEGQRKENPAYRKILVFLVLIVDTEKYGMPRVDTRSASPERHLRSKIQ